MYAKNGYGRSSFQRYRAVKIQTASPAQVMLMLYDGAIRFAHVAQRKLAENDMPGKGTYLGKVQAIVSELMSSLDHTVAPELCERLQSLYAYMMERLSHANLKRESEPIDEVIALLTTLREGWSEALQSLGEDPTTHRARQTRATGVLPPPTLGGTRSA